MARKWGMLPTGCGLAAVVLICSTAGAGYLTVVGGPTYSPNTGGYQNPTIPGTASVTDTGVAIANITRYEAHGSPISTGGIRFDAQRNFAELNSFIPGVDGLHAGRVFAINNGGTAVGYIRQYDSNQDLDREFVARWGPASDTAIQLSSPGTYPTGKSTAFGINSSGAIIGMADLMGAVFAPGGGSTLLVGPNGAAARPTAINDSGTVVGTPFTAAIRWDPGETQGVSIGSGNPKGINNDGIIFGNNVNGNQPLRWSPDATTPEQLGKLSTGPASAADINNAGIIVGTSNNDIAKRAVYWLPTGTAPTDLGMLPAYEYGSARAINNVNSIVGSISRDAPAGGFEFTAVYWPSLSSEPVDLNTLIDPLSGWILNSAEDISDTGWILGTGLFDPDGPGGQAAYVRPFLLQVPEPALALNCCAVFSLLWGRRRAKYGIDRA